MSIYKDVKTFIADFVSENSQDITENTNFVDDLGLDSTDLEILLARLDRRFELEFPNDFGLEKLITVQDFLNLVVTPS